MANYGPPGGGHPDPWPGRRPEESYGRPAEPFGGGWDEPGGPVPPPRSEYPGHQGAPYPGHDGPFAGGYPGQDAGPSGYGDGYDGGYGDGYGGQPAAGSYPGGPPQRPGYPQPFHQPAGPDPRAYPGQQGYPEPAYQSGGFTPASFPPPPERRRGRGPLIAMVVVLALLVLGGGTAAYLLLGQEDDPAGTAGPAPVATTGPAAPAEPTAAAEPQPSAAAPESSSDPRFVKAGQCVRNEAPAGGKPKLVISACAPKTYEVLRRFDGATSGEKDAEAKCAKVTGYTNWYFFNSELDTLDFVLCLKERPAS